jgi:hypothetical protein
MRSKVYDALVPMDGRDHGRLDPAGAGLNSP